MGISKVEWSTVFITVQYVQVPTSELQVCLHVDYIQPAFLTFVGICGQVKAWGIKGEGKMPSEPLIHL